MLSPVNIASLTKQEPSSNNKSQGIVLLFSKITTSPGTNF